MKYFIIAAGLFVASLFVVSCSNSLTEAEDLTIKENAQSLEVSSPVIATIKASLHRAYTGCNRRFSICGVRLDPMDGYTEIGISIEPDLGGENQVEMKIYFFEEPSITEPIFFGSDDDEFVFDNSTATIFGFSEITVLPGDYVYHDSDLNIIDENGVSRFSYGYTTVLCDVID